MTTANITRPENIVSIFKGVEEIKTLIGSVSTKYNVSKIGVSSALISAIQHHVVDGAGFKDGKPQAAGGFELITDLINEIATANPRDLPVMAFFIEKMTPFVLKTEDLKTVGRSKIEIPEIKGRRKAEFTDGDTEASQKAENADKNAVARFIQFTTATDKAPRGAKVASLKEGEKSIVKDFEMNIFDYFDYCQYTAKKAGGNGSGKSDEQKHVDSVDGTIKKIDNLLALDFITGDADIQAAAVALKDLLMAKVKADRESVTNKKLEEQAASQTKRLNDAKATAAKVKAWEALRKNLLNAGKSYEDIAEQFITFIADVRKENKEAASKAKAK